MSFIEASLFCQSTLIRHFTAQDPIHPIVSTGHGSNQRGHGARFALCSVGKYKSTFSAALLKLSIRFEDNEISEDRFRDTELIISSSTKKALQKRLLAQLQFNLVLSDDDPCHNALEKRFPHWEVHVSPRIALPEYGSLDDVEKFLASPRVRADEHLHLAVSMRSFRAEALSELVGHIVDNEPEAALATYKIIEATYPIYLTRDLRTAKAWLRRRARGTERFGLVASSGAQRLRPEGIHIKSELDPANWFLNPSTDVRSSYYLEDVASEFSVQGLELDWAGICWDGDFHHRDGKWMTQAFKGTRWQSVNDKSRRLYLKNAYRVILTRARQGMILFVPKGDGSDPTRPASFYDGTFEYLRSCGIPTFD